MKLSETTPKRPSQPVELISTKYGWLFCPPGDQYVTGSLREWGVYSETEAMILSQLVKNKRVIAAGGHIGGIAIPLGQTAESVLVFEPQPLLAILCTANVASCGLSHKVFVENAALGPEEGTIRVPVLRLDSNYNMGRLGKDDWGSGAPIHMVDFRQTLAASGCQFLLLDVEGMELEILKAGADLLPPQMWVECDRPDGGETIKWLNEQGYSTYWFINPLTPNQVRPDSGPWPMQASFNLLCLKTGEEWPLPGMPQFEAKPTDLMGNCPPERLIWSLSNKSIDK